MKTKSKVLITCEHGGCEIPREYRSLFRGQAALLRTHRGSDMGALDTARQFAQALKSPLVYSTTSRLLVDLNRSVSHKNHLSEFTNDLSAAVKNRIVKLHWQPYRQKIYLRMQKLLSVSQQVVHLSCHSFTPKLNSEVRRSDVAFLYDPSRKGETSLAIAWCRELRKLRPDLKIRRNYPYQGKDDGVMKTLRREWNASTYIGIELEVNQKHLISTNHFSPALVRDLRTSFQAVLG